MKPGDGTISNRCPQCGKFRSLKKKRLKFPHCERQREAMEQSRAEWDRKMKPLIDANRACQQLTAADYAVTINCKG